MNEVTTNEDGGRVTVATLIRGKQYTYNDVRDGKTVYHPFERNVPTPVTEDLADTLEDLTEEVPDQDGDLITKDVFRIERDAPSRGVNVALKKSRFRIVREEVDEDGNRKTAPRKPMIAPKKAGTFSAGRQPPA